MKMKKPQPLRSIAAEKKDCKAAFKKYPAPDFVWCFHHAILCERLNGDSDREKRLNVRARIREIAMDKLTTEQAARYRNFRPVRPTIQKFRATVGQFRRQWPNNTWNGRNIFPK